MTTVATFVEQARKHILAGELEQAEQATAQAKALKALDGLAPTPPPAATPPTTQRLDYGAADATTTAQPAPSLYADALKSVYVKQYGEIDRAADQVLRELYRTEDYYGLRAAKYADMERYCRYGVADPKLSRMILLTPDQVVKAVFTGVSVEGQHGFKATMVEAQDQLGGYTVPEDLRLEIISRLPEVTVLRSLARVTPISRDRATFLRRRGGGSQYTGNVRISKVDESPANAAASETNALFGQVEIPAHVRLANVPVTRSLLEDTAIPLFEELRTEFTQAAGTLENIEFLTGSGVGEPQGILNGTGTSSPHNSDITVVNSGAAAALTADGLVSVPWKLDHQYRNTATKSVAWVGAKATLEAIAKFKDGQGRYLWNELNINLSAGTPDRLRGWQVRESEAMPAIAANQFPLIFGDFQGYRIVDRIGMSIERYLDASTAATDTVIFYMRRRYGGQVVEGYRFVAVKCST